MDVKLLSPSEWTAQKEKLIAFAVRFGERRLTAAGLSELRRLSPEALAINGCGKAPAAAVCEDAFGGIGGSADGEHSGCRQGSTRDQFSIVVGPRKKSAVTAVCAANESDATDALPLAAVAVAVAGSKLAAFAFASGAGERACLVVVRPDLRGQGAGSALLQALHRRFGKLACSVAADNPASMQMCFRAGMKAVGLFTGPTGKPTLRFEC